MMLNLTREQMQLLQRLAGQGFEIVAFLMFERYIGVRKGNCAVLLEPVSGSGFRFYNAPCYLVDGHLSACIEQGGRKWFVWKGKRVEATSERLSELTCFRRELEMLLGGSA
ncbi:MAG: hypothetical protein K6U09_02265 [Acidobacteriia bacterium]|jgi:hypothetical protein|nr:hypothetical protein [Terriglobia bacterium]